MCTAMGSKASMTSCSDNTAFKMIRLTLSTHTNGEPMPVRRLSISTSKCFSLQLFYISSTFFTMFGRSWIVRSREVHVESIRFCCKVRKKGNVPSDGVNSSFSVNN